MTCATTASEVTNDGGIEICILLLLYYYDHLAGIGIVGYNVPFDTLQVNSETISPTNHMTAAKNQSS